MIEVISWLQRLSSPEITLPDHPLDLHAEYTALLGILGGGLKVWFRD